MIITTILIKSFKLDQRSNSNVFRRNTAHGYGQAAAGVWGVRAPVTATGPSHPQPESEAWDRISSDVNTW